jgi:hypothetical protein
VDFLTDLRQAALLERKPPKPRSFRIKEPTLFQGGLFFLHLDPFFLAVKIRVTPWLISYVMSPELCTYLYFSATTPTKTPPDIKNSSSRIFLIFLKSQVLFITAPCPMPYALCPMPLACSLLLYMAEKISLFRKNKIL